LPIIHALERAAKRDVEVLVILDRVNERKYSGATLVEAFRIPVWIDFEPTVAHNKVTVIDERLVIGAHITTQRLRKGGTPRMLPPQKAERLPGSFWRIGTVGQTVSRAFELP
jgi:hypothetical protein